VFLLFGQTIFDLYDAVDLHAGAGPLVHKGQHTSIGFEFDCVELLSGVNTQFLGAQTVPVLNPPHDGTGGHDRPDNLREFAVEHDLLFEQTINSIKES
jgi:hypothetical protein